MKDEFEEELKMGEKGRWRKRERNGKRFEEKTVYTCALQRKGEDVRVFKRKRERES